MQSEKNIPRFDLKMDENARHQGGSVLLLTLGVLALMSLLGTALFFMARSEQKTTADYVEQIRSQLVAESGFEVALARLRNFNQPMPFLSTKLQTLPKQSETALRHLSRSSFGALDLDGDGVKEYAGSVSGTYVENGDIFKLRVRSSQSLLNINDSDSPLNEDSDPYDDQILPERIFTDIPEHIRDEKDKDPDWFYSDEAGYDVNRNGKNLPYPRARGRLENILDALVSVLFPHNPGDLDNPENPAPDLGAKVAIAMMNARRNMPGQKFTGMNQLKSVLVPNLLKDRQFEILSKHLTLDSWRDDKVLKPTFQWKISRPGSDPEYFHGDYEPNFLMRMLMPGISRTLWRPDFGKIYNVETWEEDGVEHSADEYYSPAIIRPDWTRDNAENFYDVYLFSDAQTKFFETESRSPLDLNDASPELLKALIRPLSGWWLREEPVLDLEDFDPKKDLTAEDWSMPASLSFLNYTSHTWFHGTALLGQWEFPRIPGFLDGVYPLDEKFTVDMSHYYYYDEIMSAAVNPGAYPDPTREGRIWYAKKNKRFGKLERVEIPDDISDLVAEKLHLRIHGDGALYQPFQTWEEFEYFLHDLTSEDEVGDTVYIPGFRPEFADLLIANFNPNSRINDYNPNKEFYLKIDKSQLIANTAEFCFHPCGLFSIESRGEVLDAENKVRSSSEITVLADPGYVLCRQTTQKDFLPGFNPDLGVQSGDYLLESQSITRTSGLRLSGGTPVASYNGNTLQSYPEPEIIEAGKCGIADSLFDGYLTLATMEPKKEEMLSGSANPVFLANFDGHMDADFSAEGYAALCPDVSTVDQWVRQPFCCAKYLVPADFVYLFPSETTGCVPGNYPGTRLLCQPLKSNLLHNQPGNLYPDGVFSDAGRALRFDARNMGDAALGGQTGSLQFWLKPGFDVAHSNRIRQFFSMAPQDIEQNIDPSTGDFKFFDGMGGGIYYRRAYPIALRDFSIYYFAHGGSRIPNPTDETVPIYSPDMGGDWIPTRSLYIHANNYERLAATPYTKESYSKLGTTSANQSWREPRSEGANPLYNLETRQWNLLSFSWDLRTAAPQTPSRICLTINGKEVEARDHETLRANEPAMYNLHLLASGKPNHVRFGESTSSPFRNNVADSTFDNIVSSSEKLEAADILEEYGYGRYSAETRTAYQSPKVEIFALTEYKASVMRLHSVAWTLYWPRPANPNAKPNDPRWNGNHAQISDNYVSVKASRLTGMSPQNFPADPNASIWGDRYAPVSINIFDERVGAWRYGDLEESGDAMPNFAGGSVDPVWKSSPLIWEQSSYLRYRIHFNLELTQTLFSTPILDDISFLFISDHTRVLSWENGAQ